MNLMSCQEDVMGSNPGAGKGFFVDEFPLK